MATFMTVSTFNEGVTPEDIRAMIPQEQERAAQLEAEGSIGRIQVAMPRRTVFIEVIADSQDEARQVIESLPMASLWTTEYFETTPPAGR